MIKQIWTIRSKKKLFTGLSFGIAGFMLFYSALTLLVMENRISWENNPFGSVDAQVSKYFLLLLPLLSILCCTLLYLLSKRTTLPFRSKKKPATAQQIEAFQNGCIGENFLFSLFLAFIQLDKLDTAKGTVGFSSLVPILLVLAMIVFLIWSAVKIRQARSRTDQTSP